MLSFAIYALQVIVCSAIMMLYYGLVLRNKKFHSYNRFYVLSVFVLSWLIPLGKIYLFDTAEKPIPQILYTVASGNGYLDEVVVHSGFHVNWWLIANIAYIIICLSFVTVFVNAIFTVYKIQKNNPREFVHHFWLVFTNIAGTPFSFFKYIFWNNAIDINSSTGKQMLQHELVHVNEKHSIDSVLVQIVMCVGWFNPFFWLAKKELNVIHEFIADKKSVENGDTAAFAAMLLTAVYPQQHYLLTQSFFFSPIKRRLFMLTQNKNPKFSYMRRIIVLPLLAIVVLLFAFRLKEKENNKVEPSSLLQQAIAMENFNNGTDSISTDEFNEFVNSINSLKRTKTAPNGKTIKYYTHDADKELYKKLFNVYSAMNFAQRNRLDIAMLKIPPAKKQEPTQEQLTKWLNDKTYGVWIDEHKIANNELANKKNTDFSLYYASKLSKNAVNYGKYYVQVDLYTNKYFNESIRKDTAIDIVIRFTPPKIVKDTFTAQSALVIVDGKPTEPSKLNNLNPNQIETMTVLKGKEAIEKYGDEGRNGVVEIAIKKDNNDIVIPKVFLAVDGNKYAVKNLTGLPLSFTVFNKWGNTVYKSDNYNNDWDGTGNKAEFSGKELEEGTYYVLASTNKGKFVSFITLKRNTSRTETIRLVNKPDNLSLMVNLKNPGTDSILFIDNKTGNVIKLSLNEVKEKFGEEKGTTDSILLVDKEGNLNRIALVVPQHAITDTITSINFASIEKTKTIPQKIFTIVQTPPSFPGGLSEWQKYLERNLNADIPVKKGAPPGKYTVIVSFIVDKSGSVSDIKAENDPGYGTVDEAVRVIKRGPAWNPGIQNGQNVICRRRQTITFQVIKQ